MSKVFVLDMYGKSLNPVHPGRARILLSQGKASVFRMYPFTVILKNEVEHPQVKPLRIKLDPGSRTTGIAIVNDVSGEVVFAAELSHRGHAIKKALDSRRSVRQSRRQRKTRYRKPRWQNRRNKKKGWLPPSFESRIANILTWVNRFSWLCPITAISMELVKFDTQLMEHPEISGVEYQQGTLAGYELREYLLEKWNCRCAYCNAKGVPLQVEHIHPRAKGGTNRVSNLTLACEPCNQKKGTQDITVFLKNKPDILKHILAQAKAPLRDASAVNSTRRALFEQLRKAGLSVECGSGGLTKYNRTTRGLAKAHWLDAACVGKSTPEQLHIKQTVPLFITANGHGCRQMCGVNKYGFPRTKAKVKRFTHGFHTGDIVKAIVPGPLKNAGTHIGRMSANAAGQFTISTYKSRVTDIGKKYCRILQRADGYGFSYPVVV